MDDRRRPRWVYGVGDEPDPRFSLANERTALAGLRTALAFVAGGVALASLASLSDLPRPLELIAAVTCLVGATIAVRAAVSWARVERAMRLRAPLPPPAALGWIAAAVVVIALALAVAVLLDALG